MTHETVAIEAIIVITYFAGVFVGMILPKGW